MTRKPSNDYRDDPAITLIAVGIVVAWVVLIIMLVKWWIEVAI